VKEIVVVKILVKRDELLFLLIGQRGHNASMQSEYLDMGVLQGVGET
jgi:hypothetical protein